MASAASYKTGLIAGIAGTCLLATAAQAGTITVTDRTTLIANLGAGVTVEDFTSSFHFPITTGVLNSAANLIVANGTPIVPGLIQPGVTYSTPIGTGNFFNIDGGGGFTGGFLDRLGSLGPLTATFNSPVSGFGFDTNNHMGRSFTVDIQFVGGGSDFIDSVSIPNSLTPTGFGFESSAQDIADVIIQGDNTTSFGFALDNFTFGSEAAAVPEPASLALFGVGFAGLAALRRRKRA